MAAACNRDDEDTVAVFYSRKRGEADLGSSSSTAGANIIVDPTAETAKHQSLSKRRHVDDDSASSSPPVVTLDKSPGPPLVVVVISEQAVFEEAKATSHRCSRRGNAGARSHSAGSPIVISSEEEEEEGGKMSSRRSPWHHSRHRHDDTHMESPFDRMHRRHPPRNRSRSRVVDGISLGLSRGDPIVISSDSDIDHYHHSRSPINLVRRPPSPPRDYSHHYNHSFHYPQDAPRSPHHRHKRHRPPLSPPRSSPSVNYDPPERRPSVKRRHHDSSHVAKHRKISLDESVSSHRQETIRSPHRDGRRSSYHEQSVSPYWRDQYISPLRKENRRSPGDHHSTTTSPSHRPRRESDSHQHKRSNWELSLFQRHKSRVPWSPLPPRRGSSTLPRRQNVKTEHSSPEKWRHRSPNGTHSLHSPPDKLRVRVPFFELDYFPQTSTRVSSHSAPSQVSPHSQPSQPSLVSPPHSQPSQPSLVSPPHSQPSPSSLVSPPHSQPSPSSLVSPPHSQPSQSSLVSPPHSQPSQSSLVSPPHSQPSQPSLVSPPHSQPSQPSLVSPTHSQPSQPSLVSPTHSQPSQSSLLSPTHSQPSQSSLLSPPPAAASLHTPPPHQTLVNESSTPRQSPSQLSLSLKKKGKQLFAKQSEKGSVKVKREAQSRCGTSINHLDSNRATSKTKIDRSIMTIGEKAVQSSKPSSGCTTKQEKVEKRLLLYDSTPEISPVKKARKRRISSATRHSSQDSNRQTRLDRFLETTPPLEELRRVSSAKPVSEISGGLKTENESLVKPVRFVSETDASGASCFVPSLADCLSPLPVASSVKQEPRSQVSPSNSPLLSHAQLRSETEYCPEIQPLMSSSNGAVQELPSPEDAPSSPLRTGPVATIPAWSDSELETRGESQAELVAVQMSGLDLSSRSATVVHPASKSSWNYVVVCMSAAANSARAHQMFVEALEEVVSKGYCIPDTHICDVLRHVLCVSDPRLLLRLNSLLTIDANSRSAVVLPAHEAWELIEDCCRQLPCSRSSPKVPPQSHQPCAQHVVLLYLSSLLVADAAANTPGKPPLVQRVLSPSTQWRRVLLVINLLADLLVNCSQQQYPPPLSSLPDLLPVLARLLSMCASSSRGESGGEDGTMRLARELSSRMSKLSSVQLKTDLLLLIPCHQLRERIIHVHLQTQFPLQDQTALSSDHITLDLIAASHLHRCPSRRDGSSRDLTLFLTLLFHLLHSHCSQLLHPVAPSHLPTSPSAVVSPSELAQQIQPVAGEIEVLLQRLWAEEEGFLQELTTPKCWFYLQLLQSMFPRQHVTQ